MGSVFGATWEDPEGGFIKFAAKRALKQDQTLHMEGKLNVILYFREECIVFVTYIYVIDEGPHPKIVIFEKMKE